MNKIEFLNISNTAAEDAENEVGDSMVEEENENISSEAITGEEANSEKVATSSGEETTDLSETGELIAVETFNPDNSNVQNTLDTLPYMGKGMLGIFLVTILIVAAVTILNKTTNRKPKDDQ